MCYHMGKLILILGKKLLPHGIMSEVLKKRLDSGIKKYKPGDFFLVSGGNIANVQHTEASQMKKYIQCILPHVDIMTESKSISTVENIKFCEYILQLSNIKVVLVSSKDHLERIKKITDDRGLNWEITS